MNPNLQSFSLRSFAANIGWLVLVLGLLYVTVTYLGADDIRARVESLGVWAPLILIVAKASTLVFAPLGGAPLYPVAGALFGPVYGFFYVFVGDLIGSSLCFFISRKYGRKVMRFFVSDSGMPVVERLLTHLGTTRGFIQTRLLFIGFPEAVSYATGLTKLPYWIFISINSVVYIIPNFLLVWLGSAVVSLTPAYTALYMGGITLLAMVGVAVLFFRMKDAENTAGGN